VVGGSRIRIREAQVREIEQMINERGSGDSADQFRGLSNKRDAVVFTMPMTASAGKGRQW